MKSFLHSLKIQVLSSDIVRRAGHAVWQGVLGYLLAQLTAPHASHNTNAILTGAYAAGLSALKTFILGYVEGRRG